MSMNLDSLRKEVTLDRSPEEILADVLRLKDEDSQLGKYIDQRIETIGRRLNSSGRFVPGPYVREKARNHLSFMWTCVDLDNRSLLSTLGENDKASLLEQGISRDDLLRDEIIKGEVLNVSAEGMKKIDKYLNREFTPESVKALSYKDCVLQRLTTQLYACHIDIYADIVSNCEGCQTYMAYSLECLKSMDRRDLAGEMWYDGFERKAAVREYVGDKFRELYWKTGNEIYKEIFNRLWGL